MREKAVTHKLVGFNKKNRLVGKFKKKQKDDTKQNKWEFINK